MSASAAPRSGDQPTDGAAGRPTRPRAAAAGTAKATKPGTAAKATRPAKAAKATKATKPAKAAKPAKTGGAAPAADVAAPAARAAADSPVRTLLDRPLTSLHLVLVSTGLLLGIGLVMVLSASMVKAYADTGSTYTVFRKQLVWVAIGLPAFWLGMRLPPRVFRAMAYPALIGSVVLLMAVLIPHVGTEVDGARRWIQFGSMQLQPSEPAKLALALWGADLLVRKQRRLGELKHLMLPLLPVGLVLFGLVMLEPDLGTTICLGLVLFGLLWTVGAPGRFFAALGALAVAGILVLIVVEPYRMARLTSFLDPFAHQSDGGYQAVQGLYSLSSGGLFGVGLGQSRMTWGWLPNAHTDYIFAIIGEELGLIGCLVVLLLFAVLAYTGIRIARRSADPFARLVSGAITVWLCGQAVINMGYVVGLLPVTGIPLPLVSFGGTALVVTLFALGMLASFARHEPAAVEHLRGRRRRLLARMFGLPTPKPYTERKGSQVAGAGAGTARSGAAGTRSRRREAVRR